MISIFEIGENGSYQMDLQSNLVIRPPPFNVNLP